jgi:hypothetical protein
VPKEKLENVGTGWLEKNCYLHCGRWSYSYQFQDIGSYWSAWSVSRRLTNFTIGLIKTSVRNQPVSAHVFEYTCPVSFDEQFQLKSYIA